MLRDVLVRRDSLLAECTSVHGTILKIDSTKKIAKKLQGGAAGLAGYVVD